MQTYDLHMHTTYCDGSGSPEEMVLAAIDKGLKTVGLSGHSYTWFDESYCMSRENTEKYIEEVRRLKMEYAGRIQVLLGTELDYWAEIDTSPYDYLIGSSHYVRKGDIYQDIDYYAELLLEEVRDNYGGDILGLCEDYYAQMGNIVRRTGCDVIGHFDLVTKFNERYAIDKDGRLIELYKPGALPAVAADQSSDESNCNYGASTEPSSSENVSNYGTSAENTEATADIRPLIDTAHLRPLIDTSHPRYIAAWKKAVDQIFEDTRALRSDEAHPNRLEALGLLIAGDKPVFEINTGAMSKGNRTVPYPAPDQIEYIRSRGGILIFSSDAHSVSHIGYGFNA